MALSCYPSVSGSSYTLQGLPTCSVLGEVQAGDADGHAAGADTRVPGAQVCGGGIRD